MNSNRHMVEGKRRIELVDYSKAWPRLFAEEAARLRSVFGGELLELHHVGSTSIPGIKAKPIIDTLAVVKDIGIVQSFDEPLIKLGYRPRGECLDNPAPGTPGRFYFSKDSGGLRTHQLHVCQKGHFEIDRILAFRDFLKTHADRADAYSRLKERVVEQNRYDIVGYIKGKEEFIKTVIARAEEWKRKGCN